MCSDKSESIFWSYFKYEFSFNIHRFQFKQCAGQARLAFDAFGKLWIFIRIFGRLLPYVLHNSIFRNHFVDNIPCVLYFLPWNTIIPVALQKRRGNGSIFNVNANFYTYFFLNSNQFSKKILFSFSFSQLAERSFRFYRNVKKDEAMPENIAKEWDELRKRIEETMTSERKIKNNFEYKDLCKLNWR